MEWSWAKLSIQCSVDPTTTGLLLKNQEVILQSKMPTRFILLSILKQVILCLGRMMVMIIF